MKAKYFNKEVDLCNTFESLISDDWVFYNEHVYDILMVRKTDGYQIGIEAKLKANLKVLEQIVPNTGSSLWRDRGPDALAILIPGNEHTSDYENLCTNLGINILTVQAYKTYEYIDNKYTDVLKYDVPDSSLEHHIESQYWIEQGFSERLILPEYIPDVEAGKPSPRKLSHWKIASMKLKCRAMDHGYVTRKDFRELALSPSLWMRGNYGYLDPTYIKGRWEWTDRCPRIDLEHPSVWEQIKKDYEKEKAEN